MHHEGREGRLWRPNLLGALVLKAAAYTVPLDRAKQRHLIDFAVLSALIRRSDQLSMNMTNRDRTRLGNAIGALIVDGTIIPSIEGADAGLQRLTIALNTRSG